jgi:hypothetical protein
MLLRPLQIGLLLLSCGLAFLSGCGGALKPEQGSGVALSEERVLEPFTAIEVEGLGEVTVRFTKTDSCTVRTDDNLVEEYETRVEDGILYLSPKSLVATKVGIQVNIKTSNAIERVKLSGVCDVRLKGFSGSELVIEGDGAYKFSADGRVRKLTVNSTGNGEIELFELEATNAEVTAVGASRVNVYASGTLNVKADGAVVVTHDGDPTVTKEISGVSKLVERD